MKQQTKRLSSWRLGFLAALCMMLFTIFACTEEKRNTKDINGTAEESRPVFTLVEEEPSYDGGMDAFYTYAMKEIRYPIEARKNGVEGEVVVQFTIERNGSLSDVVVAKDIGAGAGQEAVRVVKKAAFFKAGSQRGRTVKTKMLLPIIFALSADKKNADGSPQGSIAVGKIQLKKELLQLDAIYENGAWVGTIQGQDGKPLPGANIVVKGTSYGTVSGLDGSFSVKANKKQSVQISYVGYESIWLKEAKGNN